MVVGITRVVLHLVNVRFWRALVHLPPRTAPHLYLFSKADTLVSHRDVTTVATQSELTGRKVTRVEWTGSTHVNHLQVHGACARGYWG
jgi:hypothetical protein